MYNIISCCVDKNITAKLDILMPQSLLLDVDARLKLTTPSANKPLDVHVIIKEKVMNEYDVIMILSIIIK